MTFISKFPTALHQETAEIIGDYFLAIPGIDTILVVNSCARGQAVPESDLDFAILIKPDTNRDEKIQIENSWQLYAQTQPVILKYKKSNQFAHIHLDIIDGHYAAQDPGNGEPIDYFEVEIGNQICYSAPLGKAGSYFLDLQKRWLPYYSEDLRLERFKKIIDACHYDLDHIPFFIARKLYFQAFDTLYNAFQKYLQALFIGHKTYPIAYNKWIREQVVNWLKKPVLYPKLSPILSVTNFESNEVNNKAGLLRELLNNLTNNAVN